MKITTPKFFYCLQIAICCLLCCCRGFMAPAQQQAPLLNGISPAYRIPLHQWSWQTYRTPFVHIFFSTGMDSVCRYTLAQFPRIKKEMEQKIGMSMKAVPSLIIYPSVTQSYESRIGSKDAGTVSFPTIVRQGNRMLLGFNGSYAAYTDQLRVACIRSMWQQAFGYYNGTDIRNTAAEQEWQWFKEGAIQYLATGFSMQDNEALYQWYHIQDTTFTWNSLLSADVETRTVGIKGFCYFLEQTYRKDALRQLIFQLKRKKSLSTALRLVCKRSLSQLQDAYLVFLRQQYVQPDGFVYEEHKSVSFADSIRASGILRLAYQSPDSNLVIYIRSDMQQRKVWLQQNGKKPKKLYQYTLPTWIGNHTWDVYPLVTVKGERIYIAGMHKGRVNVSEYNIQGTRINNTDLPGGIDGVSSLLPLNDREWLMTAYTKGRSDVIRFLPSNLKVVPVTNDLADNEQLQIDELGKLRYHSGYPNLLKAKSGRPVLSDSASIDTIRGKVYGWYTLAADGAPGTAQFIQSDEQQFREWLQAAVSGDTIAQKLPFYQRYWLQAYHKQQLVKDSLEALEVKYKKNTGTSFLQQVLHSDTSAASEQDWAVYNPKMVQPYRLQLHSLWFQAAINNDYFINRLQPYQGYLGTYKFPEIGGMFSSGYSDIFEQHQFSVGYKLPAGTEGSDFFVRYHNLHKRLDWYVLYFRKVESLQPDPRQQWTDAQGRPYPAAAKVKTYYYELGFNYPLSYQTALSFTAAYRKGRTVFLATDQYSLPYPALLEQWSINSLTLNHQQLQVCPANNAFYRGFRNKLLLDFMLRAGKSGAFAYGISNQLEWHQPLHKAVNWVTMLKMGYSGGDDHILYTFGGLDHNVNVQVDSNVLFDQQAPYVFQSLITQLRGFRQNSLYGNVYGLLNTDVYVQVFNGLLTTKTPYSFLNRLQLGAFADVAMAKESWREGALWQHRHSFGLSAKTIFAGYPMRLDLAFPYNFAHRPMLHFSLSL